MHKKISAALAFLALAMVLMVTPALAGSTGPVPGIASSGSTAQPTPWLTSWFQELTVWLARAVPASTREAEVVSWSAASKGSEEPEDGEEDPSCSEPGFGVSPAASPVGDPDG